MSSILDALNKLEQEKSQTVRESEHTDTDPISIANDLVGRSVLRDRVTLRVTPAALMIGVAVLVVLLIVVTFSAAILLTQPNRSAKGDSKTATATPVPVAISEVMPAESSAQVSVSPVNTEAPTDTAAAPASTTVMKSADTAVPTEAALVKSTDLAPIPPAATPKPEPTTSPVSDAPKENSVSSAKAPAAEPAPSKPAPATSPPRTRVAAKAEPEVSSVPRESGAAPARPPRNANISLDRLPVLTPQDQVRFGFARIRVNMVKASSDTTPRGMALLSLSEESDGGELIVNRMKVYEGERLRQSTLRLFKVEADRIGVEDTRSGEQYQLSH